jgi:hypothetical protein
MPGLEPATSSGEVLHSEIFPRLANASGILAIHADATWISLYCALFGHTRGLAKESCSPAQISIKWRSAGVANARDGRRSALLVGMEDVVLRLHGGMARVSAV